MTATTPVRPVLSPASGPTLHFIGVTTGSSSIVRVFPRWAASLGLHEAGLNGVDLPLHAPDQEYRRVVEFIRDDPLSRGALVTTHKLDLYRACRDLFDATDRFAGLMAETSCLSKRSGRLLASAKDPVSSGLALDAILPPGYWRERGRSALVMGAGGSSVAITWYLTRPAAGDDRPQRITVTDRDPRRLAHLLDLHRQSGTSVDLRGELVGSASDTDRLLEGLEPGALVVNATGLGKDRPGSPIGDHALFPERAVAWDLNYRGDLQFLRQARRQAGERAVRCHDGWEYFIHGWTRVIAEVFDVDIPTRGPAFDVLSDLARDDRPGAPPAPPAPTS
ncbi:shikimate dehydrogenase family protein [Kineococcus sp. SYSU DK018]|uniref:shikimate dehydrogenase family protein n=1 Tax=Kineococcus sp. SYSU DK018 TaxID=3383139 RepID=UPI003D7E298B